MGTRLRLEVALLAVIAVAACSESGTAPSGQHELDRLAGAWEVISATWGESTLEYPDGSTYWHFESDGKYYIETRTGHGYGITACGRVLGNLVMTVEQPSGTVRESHLVLSEDGESLVSVTIEATGPAADGHNLIRSTDRVTIDYDCQKCGHDLD